MNFFIATIFVSFFAYAGLLVLLPDTLYASEVKAEKPYLTNGPVPVEKCLKIVAGGIFGREKISVKFKTDSFGCIDEEAREPILFFRSTDCSGKKERPSEEDRDPNVVYKSGIDGGCPEAIEVTHESPACVTITLKSGRKVKFCY
jgi:hypothetical protein